MILTQETNRASKTEKSGVLLLEWEVSLSTSCPQEKEKGRKREKRLRRLDPRGHQMGFRTSITYFPQDPLNVSDDLKSSPAVASATERDGQMGKRRIKSSYFLLGV